MAARRPNVALEVLEEDALEARVDVLVLKHAQQLFGADKKAVGRLRINPSELPGPDTHGCWASGGKLGADRVIFVGVPPLWSFGYADIRTFASRALRAVASDVPSARVIGMTLHGVGFGLDEIEAFNAELAGLLDAAAAGEVPPALERISILELDPGRARRMGRVLGDVLPHRQFSPGLPINEAVEDAATEQLRTVGYDSSAKRHALVAMPFAAEFNDTFHYGIVNAVRNGGLLCERIDKQAFTGDVMARLKERISTAVLVVADLTKAKPNVFLEVGYAWGRDVPTVLLCKDGAKLEFDVQGQRCLRYKSIQDLEEQLTAELKGLAV